MLAWSSENGCSGSHLNGLRSSLAKQQCLLAEVSEHMQAQGTSVCCVVYADRLPDEVVEVPDTLLNITNVAVSGGTSGGLV